MKHRCNRREFLRKSALASAAGAALYSVEEKTLMAAMADKKGNAFQSDAPSAEDMPRGRLGKLEISRIILGGNLIGGWAHARDLIYVSNLFKAYNTDEKVIETMRLAERHGINTMLVNPRYLDTVKNYNDNHGGKLQVISEIHVGTHETDAQLQDNVRQLTDKGADTLYIQGQLADKLLRDGHLGLMERTMKAIKKEGLSAGIGSHTLEVTMACEKEDIGADYYMKTFHPATYRSASHEENRVEWFEKGYYDNIWCTDAELTQQFMSDVEKPWLAFKTLAAGALHPKKGFMHAFKNGADFAVVGMFDFQIAEDAAIAIDTLKKSSVQNRARPWWA